MVPIKPLAALASCLAIALSMAGCETVKPEANSWRLPKKEGTDTGMIIGRLEYPSDPALNPDKLVLNLRNVEFRNEAQAVRFGNVGEESYIMDNNYFVVPNLKPGTYRLVSFRVGQLFHGLHREEGFTYEVKPGQIKYIGSLEYSQYQQSLLQKMGKTLNYSVTRVQHPTELDMLQWLNKASTGSGWEPAIRKRMLELGRRP
ncbi:hypothetical protein [Noviherbaspirillum massiliense]|uniref:hypothetical protein n=1 Tax=Noviherbaspirillum massiliense TaxID=1465823 RepID=UPI00031FEBFA|nr:hypothetical protein [Noviherbaspirillum massiliense]